MTDTDHYAVIGNPIAHSKSPLIHTEFAIQTKQALTYTAELVEVGEVTEFVQAFSRKNGKGLNVTVPFKLDAFKIATSLSDRAQRAGAVNTLVIKGDDIFGDTTDGTGLLNDLKNNHHQTITGKRVLILGAGGAVRGVLEPLLLESPESLSIANRTLSRAEELVDVFSSFGKIKAYSFDQIQGKQFDIIINGTSASLSGELPPLPDGLFSDSAVAYDMMYGAEPTVFMLWARDKGATHIYDGLGMLVEQAAESFYLWTKRRPETQGVINKLREQLA